MEEAIEEMNGMDLDGRTITVDKAQPHQGSGRDYDGDRNRDRGRDRDRNRDYGGGGGGGGGRGSNGGECFKCGKPGQFARECPSDGARVMVLIETEIDLVGATGTLVVVEVLELIGIIVTVLDLMNAVQPEVFVPDRVTASHCGMQHIL